MTQSTTQSPTLALHDGTAIPQLGYGVWQVEADIAEDVVSQALEAGYRHIDTAKIYGNEEGVGRAIANSGIPRDEIFVTTKLWNDDHGRDAALRAIDGSLERLGLDRVDLYLIHWPTPARGKYVETWEAFQEIRDSGRARSVGVSNFPQQQLQEIIDATGSVPVVNQVELHPYFNQEPLRAFHASRGIRTEAWSPLGQGGELLQDPVIGGIARRLGATPGQVVIAWHLAIGNVVFPKTVTPERIRENFAALDVRLDPEDVEAISGLDNGGRIGSDPMDFN
ncbi:oxidoreductase [Kocuria flava]|uniref:Oxidoreductase n=1 Tax=Kocuria flava TaxID=446860 RepID=A0A2N4SZZ8_9MICC|nr:aldo/keto reductase [Kocuria flava]PLC11555.1 oxidoreductase [Kocuria flava]